MAGRGAVLVASGAAGGPVVEAFLHRCGLASADVDVLAAREGLACDGAYEAVLLVAAPAGPGELAAAARCLRRGGQLVLDVGQVRWPPSWHADHDAHRPV